MKNGRSLRRAPVLQPLRPPYWALRRWTKQVRHELRCRLPADEAQIAALQKVFILSTGRTGTMWLAHFFDTHSPRVRAVHEPYPPLLALGLDAATGRVTPTAAAQQLSRDRRWLLQRVTRPIYLEANNRLFSLVEAIQIAYPGAKVVHVVRDGRDVVRSGLRRGWYGSADRFPRLAATDFAADRWREAWAGWGMLEKGAWLWQKQNAILRRSGEGLASYRCVRFEDLFAGPEGLRPLLHFVDPDLQLDDEAVAAALAVRLNVQPRSYDETPWTAVQQETFWRIAGDEMAQYGYLP